MRSYFANLTSKGFFLLAVPVLAISYPLVMIILPAVFRAVVPGVVRSVLSLI